MEINEISRVASRKRMNVEVEKLREKVSRETNKIIKLKVAQDTAYWDLKEKLHQVEGNHERLQQNMVEVQMQHEAISGQYQDELSLRPETLNKLNSTREICGVLQDYSEKLKETLSRCKADQAALCEAYQRSGQLVRDIKDKQLQNDEKNAQTITNLEEKLKLTGEHQNQLLQMFTAFKQQASTEVTDLRSKLKETQAQNDEFLNTINELKRNMDVHKFDLDKRDEVISNLKKEIKQITDEFNAERAWNKNVLQRKDKDLKEAHDETESLKQALANQEQYTKSISEQNDLLQEKIAALEDEHKNAGDLIKDLKLKVQEATDIYNNLKLEMKTMVDQKDRSELELNATLQLLTKCNEQCEELKKQANIRENEKVHIIHDLEQTVLESNNKSVAINELTVEINKLSSESNEKTRKIAELTSEMQMQVDKMRELENAFNCYKSSVEDKLQELSKALEMKDKELDLKASTISQMMSEIKTGTDVRSKLETSLQRLKREMEMEKEADKEKLTKMANKIENLEVSVKDKEESVTKQMSLIFEMRNEKERLQSKIGSMQSTIDNIQKELTGRPPPPQADMDDNAIMLTPAREAAPKTPEIQKNKFAVPRADPPKQFDNLLFNIFSDSSMEGGDTLDSAEVNRRFQLISHGKTVSPRPLAALKRRAAVPAHRHRAAAAEQNDISLSQVKNELKNKERVFFKNKRNDIKQKKK